MAKRMLTTACMVLLTVMVAWAQGPNNTGTYYQAANGKKGEALKTAMYGIIKIEKAGWNYDGLKTAYKTT
ncbi:MAG: ribonuclease, partial [Bacteroidales bacterium]|nr:ribonuclease [Bacteroidales bacterium]